VEVIDKARGHLRRLENQGLEPADAQPQFGLFQSAPQDHPVIEALSRIAPDELTPKQAMDLLYRLKDLVQR